MGCRDDALIQARLEKMHSKPASTASEASMDVINPTLASTTTTTATTTDDLNAGQAGVDAMQTANPDGVEGDSGESHVGGDHAQAEMDSTGDAGEAMPTDVDTVTDGTHSTPTARQGFGFLKIPKHCYPPNATPDQITKCSMDRSYTLSLALQGIGGDSGEILAEMQFAFVCFLLGQGACVLARAGACWVCCLPGREPRAHDQLMR